ncbi:MAG: hypothetical protein OQK82_04800 [Candidatus Pacearchaeota archaeon]|nr:hypothetical protein [Candidatus Pacearchaeota archaeon]
MKVLTLGNEFIEEDSLAKKIGKVLEKDFEIINIDNSFELMTTLNEISDEIVLLDVVKDLDKTQIIPVDKLQNDSILSAHDFDVGYVLKLIGKDVRIIGIPMKGDVEEIGRDVKEMLKNLESN